MNLHEYQAKSILAEFGVSVQNGIVATNPDEALISAKSLTEKTGTKWYVVKAQIHAGGRGKGGGVKIINNIEELKNEAKQMLGMQLITHQTGSKGKKVKKIYIEEASDISKELYLSCLVDRASSKIAFISSTEG